MNKGDIVRYTQGYREQVTDTRSTAPLIIIDKRALSPGLGDICTLLDENGVRNEANSCWLEMVHGVATVEARHFHRLYGNQPADFSWASCVFLTGVTQIPSTLWLPGDILIRQGPDSNAFTVGASYRLVGFTEGGQTINVRVLDATEGQIGNPSGWMPRNFHWHAAGSLVNASPVPLVTPGLDRNLSPADWQAGDILDVIRDQTTGVNSRTSVIQGRDQVVFVSGNYSRSCDAHVALPDGTPCTHQMQWFALRFHSRPGLAVATEPEEAVEDEDAPRPLTVGDLVRIRTGEYRNEEAYISSIQGQNASLVRARGWRTTENLNNVEFLSSMHDRMYQVAVPVGEWHRGDTVMRIGGTNYLQEVFIGQTVNFRTTRNNGNVVLITDNEYRHPARDYALVSRLSDTVLPTADPVRSFAGWQVGDVLRRIRNRFSNETASIELGEEVIIRQPPGARGMGILLYRADGTTPIAGHSGMSTNYEWVRRPGSDLSNPDGILEDRSNGFRMGDTVITAGVSGSDNSHNPWDGRQGVIIELPGPEQADTPIERRTYKMMRPDGTDERWYFSNLQLVTPVPIIRTSPDETPAPTHEVVNCEAVGRRVQVVDPTSRYNNCYGSLIRGGNSSNVTVAFDYYPQQRINISSLRYATTEPEAPAFVPTTDIWLSLRGATNEDVQAFCALLKSQRLATDRRTTVTRFGTAANVKFHDEHGFQGGLRITNNEFYFWTRPDVNANGKGELLRDWNKVLLHLKAGKPAPRKRKPVSQNPYASLALLPAHFVIESRKGDSAVEKSQYLLKNGFRGYPGKYMMFSNNVLVSTPLRSVAEHFHRKHECPWFGGDDDATLLRILFTANNTMRSSPSAGQKFAVDVQASGPHLTSAFLQFLASIGYRQENADKVSGAFLLLNGGNMFPDQPATWQYADNPNRRSAIYNLSEVANPGIDEKSGWEKVTSRLSNGVVALPVLDEEDLDREPVVGDDVVLIDNAVTDGYPETLEVLAQLVCGEKYKVTAYRGELVQLAPLGLLVHPARVAVLVTPRGIQNNDAVVLTTPFGALKTDEVFTFVNGSLVSLDGGVFHVPATHYRALTGDGLTAFLLKRSRITLPCLAEVVATHKAGYGETVTITHAWPLNNQTLGFWTQEQDMNAPEISWYEPQDLRFQLSIPGTDKTLKVTRGATREESFVKFGDQEVSLAVLEDVLSS